MASPTVPWGIPQFDDNTPFAPIQAPFNSQSAALNTALNDLDNKTANADSALKALTVGSLGSDGNATVSGVYLKRTSSGLVYLSFRATRTNATTYADSLIAGVLPVGFRPVGNVNFGGCLTYGSGTINQIQALASGVIQLTTPAPAGHTILDGSITFMAV